jgi:hypothetical protein
MTDYLKTKTFESGANGDNATTGNTNSDSLNQTAGAGTMQISTAEHHSGTRSLHITGTSTNGLYCMVDELGGLNNFTADFYMKLAALPSGEETIFELFDLSNAVLASLSISSLGQFICRNSTAGGRTNIWADPSGKRVSVATGWFHGLWEVVSGTSGSQRWRWYPDGSGTATSDSTVIATNNGAGLFDSVRSGPKSATTTATIDAYLDDITMSGSPPASITGFFVYDGTGWVKHDAYLHDGSTWNLIDIVGL